MKTWKLANHPLGILLSCLDLSGEKRLLCSQCHFRNCYCYLVKVFSSVNSVEMHDRKCLENIAKNLYISSDDNNDEYVVVPWYHGCISRANAEKILITKSPLAGDFLVRISESQAGKFTISYVGSNRQFKNILIKNNEDGGYALHPEGDETFDSISGKWLINLCSKH